MTASAPCAHVDKRASVDDGRRVRADVEALRCADAEACADAVG